MMKRNLILCTIFVLFFAWIFAYTLDVKLDLNGDNANYIMLARNMAKGMGYATLSPDGLKPASHFPPGYSTLLAGLMTVGIHDLVVFKVLNGLFLCICIILLAWMAQKSTRQSYLAFGIAMLSAMSPQLMHFAGMVMSEMFFLLCCVLSLFAMFKYSESTDASTQDTGIQTPFYRNKWFYITILAAVTAYYIRTVAAAIIVAVGAFFLFRKDWKALAANIGGVILLVAPWSVRNAMYGIKSRYFGTIMTVNPWRPEEGSISSFGELFDKMLVNFDETVIKGFKEILFPFMTISYDGTSSFLGIVGGLIIVAIIFWGAWNIKRIRWALLAFIVGNMGLFALWHGGNGSRYVVPIAPILYLCFYLGVYHLVILGINLYKKNKTYDSALMPEHCPWLLALCLMLLPMRAPIQSQNKIANMPYPKPYEAYFRLAKDMNSKLPKGSVICCRKPELFTYYAPKLFTYVYKFDLDPDVVVKDLLAHNVDYVIYESLGYGSTPRYLLPALQKHQELFPCVWKQDYVQTYLFKFDKERAKQKFNL